MRIFLEELESALPVGKEVAFEEGVSLDGGGSVTGDKVGAEALGSLRSSVEYTNLSKARKDLMVLAKSKRVRLHLCRHDEGLPCTIEDPFLSQSVTDSDGTEVVHTGKPGYRK